MHPYLLNNKHIVIESFSLLFLLGWITGGLLYYYSVKKQSLNLETMLTILCGCVVGAMFGSLVLNIIIFGHEGLLAKLYQLDFQGMSVVGGISGGFIGVEITKKCIGYQDYTGDLFVMSILIGHSIGRLGCLLGGCCFGTQCILPWGITYPLNSPAYFHQLNHGMITINSVSSLPVHPTPIYEIIFNMCLLCFLFINKSRFHISGALFRTYIVAYCLFRLFVEFVRADTGLAVFMGLKPIQINLFLAILYFSWWLWKNNKPKPELSSK